MANSCSSVTLKLLIDTKREQVLFAEGGKDFVDFLFTLLSLPISTVIRLLSKDGMVGSIGKLYQSVENLSEAYMQSNRSKDTLLKPKAPVGVAGTNNILPLLNSVGSNARAPIYTCSKSLQGERPFSTPSFAFGPVPSTVPSYCQSYYTDDPKTICPNCRCTMNSGRNYVAPPRTTTPTQTSGASEGGYVKGVVTYMVMDDLEVKPMSTISSITILNRFNVKDVGALEEKVVSLGMDEGVKLLKASLESKSVLTNVFLRKKAASTYPQADLGGGGLE